MICHGPERHPSKRPSIQAHTRLPTHSPTPPSCPPTHPPHPPTHKPQLTPASGACPRYTLHNDFVELSGHEGAYLLDDLLLILTVSGRQQGNPKP